MNTDEFIAESIRRIIEQGAPSYDSEADECRYYDPKTGRQCTIGIMLPVEVGSNLSMLFVTDPLVRATLKKHYPDVNPFDRRLIELQSAHDVAALKPGNFIENFKEELRKLRLAVNLGSVANPSGGGVQTVTGASMTGITWSGEPWITARVGGKESSAPDVALSMDAL